MKEKKEKIVITLARNDVALVFKPNKKIKLYLPDTKKDLPFDTVATIIAINLIEKKDERIMDIIDEIVKEIVESPE